jgi:hypothetical protein
LLYPQLLQSDFAKLPRVLREFHTTPGGGRASGKVVVHHANRLLARIAGFPPPGHAVTLQLEILAADDREIWRRRFGPHVRESIQQVQGSLLVETAGPIRIFFRVFADSHGLRFESQRARFLGIPLPLRISAEARAGESSWDLEVTVKGIGGYRGIMAPVL